MANVIDLLTFWWATKNRCPPYMPRWVNNGTWEHLWQTIIKVPDLEGIQLDSTVVRAHQHSAGAEKKHGPQSIDRSKGGLTTKIHLVVDALGNPIRMLLTPGQTADISKAHTLLHGLNAGVLNLSDF